MKSKSLPLQQMSEEQLSALLAKLKEDAGLLEKLKGAGDLDAAEALAKEAGFDVSREDWIKYQAQQTLELSDEELEEVSGGFNSKGCPRPPRWTENRQMRECGGDGGGGGQMPSDSVV